MRFPQHWVLCFTKTYSLYSIFCTVLHSHLNINIFVEYFLNWYFILWHSLCFQIEGHENIPRKTLYNNLNKYIWLKLIKKIIKIWINKDVLNE